MAAWGGAGAWSAAVEEEEKEHGSIQAPVVKENDFPSLGAAVTVKETKKDRKKKQTMSLADFVAAPIGGRSAVNDDSILLNLPTAPRGHVDGEEPRSNIGGGFREYGGGSRFGGRGGGDRYGDERRPRRGDDDGDEREPPGPSRADESDSWGADRKFVPSEGGARGGGGRGFGGGGFGDREDRRGGGSRFEDDGPSRADTGDWGARRPPPFEERGERGNRDTFRDREPREPSKADTESRWEHKADSRPIAFEERPRRGGFEDENRGSRGRDSRWGSGGGALDRPSSRDGSADRWRKPDAPGSDEGPKERPKLQIAPRSAPAEATNGDDGNRSSIFGAARPREAVLKEQGRDAVTEDLKLEEKPAPPPAKEPRAARKETGNSEESEQLRDKIMDARSKVNSAENDEDREAAEAELKDLQAQLLKLKGPSGKERRDRGGRPRSRNDNGNSGGDKPERAPKGPPGLGNGRENRERRSNKAGDNSEKPAVAAGGGGAKW